MYTREEALIAIVASIAKEEESLAALIKAESEKINFAIERTDGNMCMLLKINESVDSVITHVGELQLILKNKLGLALSYLPKPPSPCPPIPPVPPPKPPCHAVFTADSRYCWSAGKTLILEERPCSKNNCGLKSIKKKCDSFILLPAGKNFTVKVDFEGVKLGRSHATIELKQESGDTELFSRRYYFKGRDVLIYDTIKLKQNKNRWRDSLLSFRLISESGLEFKRAIVTISESEEK